MPYLQRWGRTNFCKFAPVNRDSAGGVRAGLLLLAICWGACLAFPLASVQGAEPHLKFLEGLRSRQYFDTAMMYLDSLEQRDDVAADIKQRIPYERGVTLIEGAKFVQNSEAQGKQLDQAQASLERFLKESPQHELAALANTELARIMLGKAEVLVWRARSPSNAENRGKFQKEARELVVQAKGIFQKAYEGYKKEYDSFPVYIPEEDKQARADRARVESLYMRSQLDLAMCTYQMAQAYDKDSNEFKETLKEASLEFEEIHTKYRSQFSGLYARAMQGKCFEEQDDIRKALGIYDELLSHGGQSAGLKRLQHQVRLFRLICLNHETRKDYQLVIQEAGDWVRQNRSLTRSQNGLGIRWEMAKAQEALGMDRTTPESDRVRYLRQALENAREVNKYAGPYKDVSNSMIQRVLIAMDREPGDPKDFDTAFGMANNMLEQIGTLRDKVKAAEKANDKEEAAKLGEELQALLSETERMYRLALALANANTTAKQINASRYRLAYMLYLQRKSFETAVVGQFLAIRAKESDPSMALDGAYLAMAGFSQAYNDAPEAAKETILNLVVEVSELIVENWPDSDRAIDARMEMGRIFRREDQPLRAAEWYSQVPETAPQYGDAQLEAGQAFWSSYLMAVVGEDATASSEDLKSWQDKAAEHLYKGIKKKQEAVPESATTPSEITRAKVSLSQIEIMRGNEQGAIDLLTKEPHSVVKAITVADGESRPKRESDVKSSNFASFAYQQLLRAYIGTRQLDKAEEARAKLEQVAGAAGGEALTAVYVELGRELQNELERLRKQGDQQRLDEVRNGFETFLGNLFERKDGQTYGSLIWIAETYFGLAEGSDESPSKRNQFYSSAARAYEEIIKRGASNAQFIDPARLTGVKLRLVNCRRQEGNFEEGEKIVMEILTENPRALDAQIEAASLYQSWGKEDATQFLNAIRGVKTEEGANIWGWGQIALRLQMLIDSGQGTPEYEEKNREARFRLAESRLQYAERAEVKEAEEQLKRAKLELLTYTSITPDLPDTRWWAKFDDVYQDILRNLGEAVVPLVKPDVTLADTGSSNYDSGQAQAEAEQMAAQQEAGAQAPPATQPAESNMLSYILMGIVLLGGLGGAGYLVASSGKKSKHRSIGERVSAAPSSISFPVEERADPRQKTRSASATPATGTAERKPSRTKTREATGEEKRRPASSGTRPDARPEKRAEGGEAKRVRRRPPEQA